MMKRIVTAGLVLAMGTAAQAALTQLNFAYDLVTGSYDSGSTTFSLSENASTTGDVTVTADPSKKAQFAVGDADIDASLTVSSITATTADGAGTITLTDVDGSTISAAISGTFTLVAPGNIFFTGLLSGVTYTFADTTFDGSTGSFGLSDFNTNATLGEIVSFEFTDIWFTAGDFSVDTIQVDGSTKIPVPGAALLGALGLTAITSIRRRLAS